MANHSGLLIVLKNIKILFKIVLRYVNFDQKEFFTSKSIVKLDYENKIYFLILRLNQGSYELFITHELFISFW